ncbi:hypothetical protein CAEBREN_28671 [Caenorhabditis brenneri]|uniref:Uncharacterized protein n=1 Tax=Caenorhabditis brenneri TaxID=135651 RepID=G0NMD7_CAEBE|nr:hypothetical protein CAEBREN_28671 [Caenorhabditis brenneri]
MSDPAIDESQDELRAAGMSEASIEGLTAFTRRFQTGLSAAQASAEGPDKFIEEYTADVQKFRDSMPEKDRAIYNDYLKKNGL